MAVHGQRDAGCARCSALQDQLAALQADNERLRQQLECVSSRSSSSNLGVSPEPSLPRGHQPTDTAASVPVATASPMPPPINDAVCSLRRREMQRYSRQMLVPDFAAARQLRLRTSRVLIIGAGGLGCPAALYLAAMGVGTLTLVDNDRVERSNLHRQIGHSEATLHALKVDSLAQRLRQLNPDVSVTTVATRFAPSNADDLVESFDVVVDASDNPTTRYLINDVCARQQKSLVSGSALGLEGQVTVFTYAAEQPCYRCLYPHAPVAPQSCEDNGVLGVVPGIIGCLQALETIKLLTAMGEPLVGSQLLFDAYDSQFRRLTLAKKRRSDCSSCQRAEEAETARVRASEASTPPVPSPSSHPSILNITVHELAALRLQEPQAYVLLDTRAAHQYDMVHFPEAINVPFERLRRLHEQAQLVGFARDLLQPKQHQHDSADADSVQQLTEPCSSPRLLVLCRRGIDSVTVTEWLTTSGLTDVYNVEGGYTRYADPNCGVDASFPMY